MTESTGDAGHNPDHDEAQASLERVGQAMANLKAAGDGGASWFFWIAGLSLVNTMIAHSGGDRHFIVGLAITAIVDAIASVIGQQNPDAATVAMAIAIGFSILVAGLCLLFGWLSRKRLLWVYGIGMFLYVLDGLLYLVIGDYLSAGFHGYALFSMFQGFNAYKKLRELEAALTSDDSPSEATGEVAGFEPV